MLEKIPSICPCEIRTTRKTIPSANPIPAFHFFVSRMSPMPPKIMANMGMRLNSQRKMDAMPRQRLVIDSHSLLSVCCCSLFIRKSQANKAGMGSADALNTTPAGLAAHAPFET